MATTETPQDNDVQLDADNAQIATKLVLQECPGDLAAGEHVSARKALGSIRFGSRTRFPSSLSPSARGSQKSTSQHDAEAITGRKPDHHASGGLLSCPFRKRNRARFNIRDHVKCTKAFSSLSLLKHHVRSCHQLPLLYEWQSIVAASVRCWSQFASLTDLSEHHFAIPCQLQSVSSPPERDVEDGITPDVAQRIIERSSRRKVATWEDLWTALFPDDAEIPSSAYENFALTETFVNEAVDAAGSSSRMSQAAAPPLGGDGNAMLSNALTDSGYASAFHPLLLDTQLAYVDEKAMPSLDGEGDEGVEDDEAKTTYSSATTVSQAKTRHYISELSSEIAKRLSIDVDVKKLASLRDALPELIKGFSVKLGLESASQINRDIMYFVHKHHRDIALQFESTLACQDDEVTIKHHDLDKMSLSEKMNLWDSKVTTDQEPIPNSDTLFHGVEDDDESINLAGLSGYSNVISGSRALAWLVASLGQRSLLQWGSDGIGDLAVNKIRQTILKSLPSEKISKREPPRQHTVSFRLKWSHIMNQPQQERTDRLNTIVITVCSGNAQVTSVDQYMHQTWPWSGDLTLDLLRCTAGLKRGSRDASGTSSSVESVSFLWDNMKITVRYDGDYLVLTTTSSTRTLAEFGEQLAWITAALWPRARDSTTSSSPFIVRRDLQKVSGTPVLATICFDMLVQQSPLAPEELWWTDMVGRHPVVVRGFPVPRQPEGYIGLEHSFVMLTTMGYHLTSLDSGKIRLTGPEKMLALVKRVNTVFIWRDVRCLSHRCYAVDDSERSADLENATSHFDLSMGTHIVTPCENICKGGIRNGMPMLAGSRCGVAGPGTTPTDTSFESDLFSTSDLSDSLSSLDRKLPALPLVRDAIVRRLVLGYCHAHAAAGPSRSGGAPVAEMGNGATGFISSSSTSAFNNPSGSSGPGKKRSCQEAGDDDDESPPEPLAPKRGRLAGSSKLLACPFWKAYPHRHRCCFTKILSRIRDVKQHLRRYHYSPFSCNRCSAAFPDEQTLREHDSDPNGLFCTPSPQLDRISSHQHVQMACKSGYKLSEGQQWFALWDIVFPGRRRPPSAYRDADITEELCSFREYCATYGEGILDDATQAVVATGQWQGFGMLSGEERQGILRWVVRDGFELAFRHWISARASVARLSRSGEMTAQSATPAAFSLPDSGIVVEALPRASEFRLEDALECEHQESVEEGIPNGFQEAVGEGENRVGPPPAQETPQGLMLDDDPGFEFTWANGAEWETLLAAASGMSSSGHCPQEAA